MQIDSFIPTNRKRTDKCIIVGPYLSKCCRKTPSHRRNDRRDTGTCHLLSYNLKCLLPCHLDKCLASSHSCWAWDFTRFGVKCININAFITIYTKLFWSLLNLNELRNVVTALLTVFFIIRCKFYYNSKVLSILNLRGTFKKKVQKVSDCLSR